MVPGMISGPSRKPQALAWGFLWRLLDLRHPVERPGREAVAHLGG